MCDLPLFPVYLSGPWPAAGWYSQMRIEAKRDPEKYGPEDLEEASRDALLVCIDDQLRAGADVVSPCLNVMGVAEGLGVLESISGLEPVAPRRKLPPRRRIGSIGGSDPVFRMEKAPLALRGLGVAVELERLRALTSTMAVATLPGPFTLAGMVHGGPVAHGREAVAAQFCSLLRGELETLANLGVEMAQLDESGAAWAGEDPKSLADLIRRVVDGLPIEVAVRLSTMDSLGRPGGRRKYRPWLVDLANAMAAATINVRQFDLSFAAAEMAEIEIISELPTRRVALGLVDVSSPWIEPAHLIADRVRLALKVVPAERIYLSADAGLGSLPRSIAARKVASLNEAAKMLREEMGIREAIAGERRDEMATVGV